jgi:hypothetical protein
MNRTNIRFVLCLALICSTAAVVPASAQQLQLMEGSLTQIAAGSNEVWGLSEVHPYRFKAKTRKFTKIKGAQPIQMVLQYRVDTAATEDYSSNSDPIFD